MAGVGAAGLGGPGLEDVPHPASVGGVLSPLARAQYTALARLRWRIFVNGLRSNLGAIELGARTVAFVLYGFIGLGIGVGAGVYAYVIASGAQWQYLPIVFWGVCLMWQVVPIMLSTFQEQFDLGTLLRFPVGFSAFFFLYIVFGLADVSTILGFLCCLGILIGVTLAEPALFFWTAIVLVLFAAFNILLVRTIFAWIDRWLSQRRTREIVGGIFMALFLSLQLVNPALWQHGRPSQGSRRQQAEFYRKLLAAPWVQTVEQTQAWLPPGLAAAAVEQATDQQPRHAVGALGISGLFIFGVGGVLGVRLRAEYRGENLSAAPALAKTTAKPLQGRERIARSELSAGAPVHAASPIGAIMGKEFQTMMRTLPLLYAVGAPLVLVIFISGPFVRAGIHGHMPLWAFPMCVFFAQLGFRQLFGNNLGTEGAGIQLYFLAPTPLRTVLLAKNLCHSIVFAFALVLAGLLATLRLGVPDGLIVAITIAWLMFALPVNLAVGNILSITMPYRVNPGRISRQRGSQASTIISLLLQACVLGFGAAVFQICFFSGVLWMAIPSFLVLAVVAVAVWLRILGNSDDIAAQRKDMLLATLMKAE
jgi:ABC-2 type transport system permease protein